MKDAIEIPEDVTFSIKRDVVVDILRLIWKIQAPLVVYDKDPLVMANRVLVSCAKWASEIEALLPEV